MFGVPSVHSIHIISVPTVLLRSLIASTSINSIPSSNNYSCYISLLVTALAALDIVLG